MERQIQNEGKRIESARRKTKEYFAGPRRYAKGPKKKAVFGLVTSGIPHSAIQAWALRGSADQDKAKRIAVSLAH